MTDSFYTHLLRASSEYAIRDRTAAGTVTNRERGIPSEEKSGLTPAETFDYTSHTGASIEFDIKLMKELIRSNVEEALRGMGYRRKKDGYETLYKRNPGFLDLLPKSLKHRQIKNQILSNGLPVILYDNRRGKVSLYLVKNDSELRECYEIANNPIEPKSFYIPTIGINGSTRSIVVTNHNSPERSLEIKRPIDYFFPEVKFFRNLI